MMRRLITRYRGVGTGLRLEDPANAYRCLDVTGSAAKGTPLQIYVGICQFKGASIDLHAADVALLAERCAAYLAREAGA